MERNVQRNKIHSHLSQIPGQKPIILWSFDRGEGYLQEVGEKIIVSALETSPQLNNEPVRT